jgi:methylglutaconyl-CoA hydratase
MKTLAVTHGALGVTTVEMARPEVYNAFDEVMIEELAQVFTTLGADPAVRVIVLTGRGKAFSAGADLQWMKRASVASEADNVADARKFATMLQVIDACPKPTIARVHGVALGGGVGLICACDMAVASDDASFAASEARFGILPSVIGPYLTNAVGRRHARRLALLASRIGANEAKRIGMIDEVVPRDGLDAAVQAWVDELLRNGPESLGEIKLLFSQLPVGEVTEATRELTARTIARVRMTDEAREGFAAFLGKRPPAWMIEKDTP